MAEADLGAPQKVFKTFKGRYELTINSDYSQTVTDVIMLSCTNELEFLGDIILDGYSEGETIATLPEDCRPKDLCRIPCVYGDMIAILNIEPEGTLNLYAPTGHTIEESGVLYISGTSFNISDRWYQ